MKSSSKIVRKEVQKRFVSGIRGIIGRRKYETIPVTTRREALPDLAVQSNDSVVIELFAWTKFLVYVKINYCKGLRVFLIVDR